MAKKARTPPPPRVNAPRRREDQGAGRLTLDRRILYASAAGVALLIVVIALVVLAGGSGDAEAAKPVVFSQLTGLQQGPPPWNNGAGALPDNLAALDLNQLVDEGQVLHVHQHLDLWIDGKKVKLPSLIGIYANQFLTEIHTHDAGGLIHVESPKKRDFTLGQLFGEWGVKLTSNCIGSFCGRVQWWVNGEKQTGNPAALVLKSHQEIVLVRGKPPAKIPKQYKFGAGE